jgi:hypothetical protein
MAWQSGFFASLKSRRAAAWICVMGAKMDEKTEI